MGGTALGLGGWEAFRLFKRPDLAFVEQNKETLDHLAETIIPVTDSPGAKDAAVGAFILKMIRDCTPRKSQNNFIRGLADIMARAQSEYARPFVSCSQAEKTALLEHFEKEGRPYRGLAGKLEHQLTGDSFFTTLKKYTVLGYCTSKPGATQGMRYDFIPGKYVASLPLQPGQRSWATE